MVQVSASSFQGQLGFEADCSCQVQCPRQALILPGVSVRLGWESGCHSLGTEVASGSSV